MIYLFSGDDSNKRLVGYEKFMKSRQSGEETFVIERNNFDPMQIESLYSGSSLFSSVSNVVFRNILEKEDMKEFVLTKLSVMQTSQNLFIFLEGKLNKPILDAFKKVKAEINVFDKVTKKTEKFNNFLLANAFGAKDKLNLWIYYRQALAAGAELESLVGILFWKIKDMILKRNFGKFSEAELKNLSSRISYLLPESRQKGQDTESALEQFLLEAF